VEFRDTRYVKTPDDAYLAYQVTGDGPIDLTWLTDIGNIDLIWEWPNFGQQARQLAKVCRFILHDRRGIGLSSRNVALPNLETRVADLRLVLDTVGAEHPILGGAAEPGAANILLAATEPDRVSGIIWYSPTARLAWAPDYPWGVGPDYFEREQLALELWGTAGYGEAFADTEASIGGGLTPEETALLSFISRQTATPDVARELSRISYETDIRALLPSVRAPSLLISHERWADEMEYIASLMPNATTVSVPGPAMPDNFGMVLDATRDFLGVRPAPVALDTVLATVLFTDIVGSTERQATLGDRAWKDLVERHHLEIRTALGRWRGTEIDNSGDGFFAAFDGPARAIHCAREAVERVRALGLEIRAGVHTGECELINGKVGGLAVTIGARIADLAGSSEVLISQTVKDLVAGSGLSFRDAGEHTLKGVPDVWRLYEASDG
jgi:class 3 adenylate cyclase/pimeloyl-ACP methyl ester carboxylesterase